MTEGTKMPIKFCFKLIPNPLKKFSHMKMISSLYFNLFLYIIDNKTLAWKFPDMNNL